jgi:hypothetical protein
MHCGAEVKSGQRKRYLLNAFSIESAFINAFMHLRVSRNLAPYGSDNK